MNIKYSQNFLQDPVQVQQLVDYSSLNKDDIVIEIGPGKGIITEVLAKRCKNVIAVEIDPKLADGLTALFKNNDNVQIIKGDFLEYSLPTESYKIFSNIPFNITADIMRKIFDGKNPPTDAYLITQREVADKYCGTTGETLMSVLNKPFFGFSIVHHFKRNDFLPIANVDCAMLRVKKLELPQVERKCVDLYRDFISFGFSGTKPTLKKTCSDVFGHVQFLRLSTDLGFAADAKPTDLTFDQWQAVFSYFYNNVQAFRQQKVRGSYLKSITSY